jgi:hypothetical protein
MALLAAILPLPALLLLLVVLLLVVLLLVVLPLTTLLLLHSLLVTLLFVFHDRLQWHVSGKASAPSHGSYFAPSPRRGLSVSGGFSVERAR